MARHTDDGEERGPGVICRTGFENWAECVALEAMLDDYRRHSSPPPGFDLLTASEQEFCDRASLLRAMTAVFPEDFHATTH